MVAWICLILALLFQGIARNVPGFADWYAHHIYPLIVGSVGRVFGWFPFSVSEFGIYVIVVVGNRMAIRADSRESHGECEVFCGECV
ncbi:MAG: DUF3810 family protein [Lachnospiraceae bacterium]